MQYNQAYPKTLAQHIKTQKEYSGLELNDICYFIGFSWMTENSRIKLQFMKNNPRIQKQTSLLQMLKKNNVYEILIKTILYKHSILKKIPLVQASHSTSIIKLSFI